MPAEYKSAFIAAIGNEAAGSAFMHGSQTELGHLLDTRGFFPIALMAHQVAVAQLPAEFRNNPVLRDFDPAPQQTGLEQVEAMATLMREKNAIHWYDGLGAMGKDISKPIAAMVCSMLTLVLPNDIVDSIVALVIDILHKFVPDPKILEFITEQYIPAIRNATAHVHLSPRQKLETLMKGVGSFAKFIYAVPFQEELLS